MSAPSPGERTEPLVSVIVPCFDAAHFVADAVGSVVAQGVPDVEILVVDDGSSDGEALGEALRPFGSAVTRLDGPHMGLGATRNRGVAAARGRWVAFLDADDVWRPGFLARQLELLERTGADLAYCDAEYFDATGPLGRTVMQDFPSRGDVTLGAVLSGRCMVVMSTIVARADRVRAVGAFDPERRYCEDLDLWVRMLENDAGFVYHTEADALRRIHSQSMSRQAVGMLEGAVEVIGRRADSDRMTAGERGRVRARLRRMEGELCLYAAKRAIREGDPRVARRELFASFSRKPGWKPLVAGALLTLAPGPALRYLSSRPE